MLVQSATTNPPLISDEDTCSISNFVQFVAMQPGSFLDCVTAAVRKERISASHPSFARAPQVAAIKSSVRVM